MSDDVLPPEGGQSSEIPPPPASPAPAATGETPSQPNAEKRPVHPGFLILGLVTPWLASALIGAVVNALSLTDFPAPGPGVLGAVLSLVVLVGIIVAFVRGRTTGNDKLRSFGLGGLISYAATILVSLLAFGACFVLAGGNLGF